MALSVAAIYYSNMDEPGAKALQARGERIATRICRLLEKRGLVERDIDNAWLAADATRSSSLDDLRGHLINYRIAIGPRGGQKLLALQNVPADAQCTVASIYFLVSAPRSNDVAAM